MPTVNKGFIFDRISCEILRAFDPGGERILVRVIRRFEKWGFHSLTLKSNLYLDQQHNDPLLPGPCHTSLVKGHKRLKGKGVNVRKEIHVTTVE